MKIAGRGWNRFSQEEYVSNSASCSEQGWDLSSAFASYAVAGLGDFLGISGSDWVGYSLRSPAAAGAPGMDALWRIKLFWPPFPAIRVEEPFYDWLCSSGRLDERSSLWRHSGGGVVSENAFGRMGRKLLLNI